MATSTELLPNGEVYNRWAPTYDTDGNILQSLDSIALSRFLLPRVLSNLERVEDESQRVFNVTDLGCGTGRATLALLSALEQPSNCSLLARLGARKPGVEGEHIQINGLDSSNAMMDIAKSRVLSLTTLNFRQASSSVGLRTDFQFYDLEGDPKSTSNLPAHIMRADAVICSLVIEHLASLPSFFQHLTSGNLLRQKGLLVLTNMHPDMATGAGFTDVKTGSKIRAAGSYAHTVAEVLETAKAYGFEVVDGEALDEMRVEGWMIEQGFVDNMRGEKWLRKGTRCWFGGVLRLKG